MYMSESVYYIMLVVNSAIGHIKLSVDSWVSSKLLSGFIMMGIANMTY